ncbi:hypothetical protein FE257_006702 [Aspergillus nanangensis]|uniref:Uncharacterized protein n=1 Tax=Aspergillus nanangensis TaxID=2582783 RepID=A0AAD4GUR5_ASPNN|nr:hypothetical protein FE257_006702 [Aspergillus nanangensis]
MSNPTTTRKRGRPPKYTSIEERDAAKIERQRKRRDALQATRPITQSNPVHSTGVLSMTLPGPSHPLIVSPEETSFTQEQEALLPPLSPGLAPFDNEDDDIIDHPSPPPDYPRDTSPPLETLILPTPSMRSEQPPDNIEIRAPSPTMSEPGEEICTLARVLADQLYQHHGCCHQCHEQQHTTHQEAHPVHTALADYLEQINPDGDFPDVLGSPMIATHGSNLAEQVTPERKQQVYCGVDSQQPDLLPTHLCIAADHHPGLAPEITLDIDSVGGFVKSLAVARQGIRWYPTQMPVSDLQSSLHLNPILVQYLDSNGRAHRVHRPLHQVPHYTVGRLMGFEDISMYLLFPRLYRENQQSSRLLDQHFKQWMDDILLPIINRCYSGDLVQHYPSSFEHSQRNATARGVEMRSQRVDPVAREQRLFYFLPPEALATVWEQILEATQRPGYHQFQDLQILIEGKNLKTLTKATTLLDLIEGFQQHWQRAIDESYLSDLFFYDLGKETCLPAIFNHPESQPYTLLWRRCCLEAYSQWIHGQQPSDTPRAHEQFYPMSLLQDTGSMTLETRRSSPQRQSGLFYSQFYASVKEIFTAGNTYPFTNSGMETLALDPKLRKTWQTVGGGLSHNPIALNRAYLATKQRCHAALQGSIQKVFGLREEHRVSHILFNQIIQEFSDRGQFTIPFPRTSDSAEHFYALPTATLLQWFQWNINKFCVGFEMVYSLNDRHFVTWEHTRMMLMFLRCLPFSYSGGLLERVSGCWRDVWFRPDPTQLDGLRRCEGLGFQHNMEQSGYGWFLNKINWEMMVFRQPAAPYMQFNNPSLQAAYHARYSQVRDVRVDFICISQIHQWMTEFSGIHTCQEYLQKYLRQLCLRAFRKDVFAQIQPLIKKESIPAALAGDIPLCWPSLEEALLPQHCPPYVAAGNRMAVKHIDVLFTWLWEWRDGRFQRKGWENKPYRLLYQKSIEIITLIQGKDTARQWKQGLKTSFI